MDSKRRYRIVIALDGSEYSEIVLEHALDQAARHDTPDLHILTVVEKDSDLLPIKTWLATCVLEGLDTFRSDRPDWRTRLHVRAGRADEEIVNLAGEIDADLLVIGRYGLHHRRGSTADRVVASVECPTLVVGLAGHTIDPQPQCVYCVATREESDGERWFCATHAGDRIQLSTLVPWSASLTHGGPLW
jgi:nucleotide-binding universal stress UspA family protein